MIYLLILRATFGPAIVGHFDTEPECKAGAAHYVQMLVEHKSDDRHNAQLACVGFPIELPEPRTWRQA